GNDSIDGGLGTNALLGGDGVDYLTHDGTAAQFYAAGPGDDYNSGGADGEIFAFNVGDGADQVFVNPFQTLTLSLGGASASDIALTRDGSDILIEVGGADSVDIGAYGWTSSIWPQGTLQIVDGDIRTYDLNAVVQAFLDAEVQDPGLSNWSAADALAANLLSTSTTDALGGAIAYEYATTGGVAGLSSNQMWSILGDPAFGFSPQPISIQSGNAVPVVSATDSDVLLNDSLLAATLFSVFDEDGQTPTQYEFYDDVEGGGYFSVNGTQKAAGIAIPVSATDLANTEYVAGVTPGTERVWVRAYDGEAWSAWQSWTMTSALHIPDAAPDAMPAAATQTVLLDESVAASSLFS
ncbi:MAG: hypothetical protein ACRENK_02850, partial [Gemmatimonadaceae bacterium]